MPFPFTLPTTSSLDFSSHLASSTHPSLPLTATQHRNTLRNTLKQHKRLQPAARPAHLPRLLSTLTTYIPYLHILDSSLSSLPVSTTTTTSSSSSSPPADPEHVDLALSHELLSQWRPTLSATPLPARDPPRIKVRGLDAELAFTLLTFANAHCLCARAELRDLYDRTLAGGAPSPEERGKRVAAAMKHLLAANGLYSYLVGRSNGAASDVPLPADVTVPVLAALAALSLAEATLAAVLRDDGWAAAAAQERHRQDNEWMFAAPKIPAQRVSLLARVCLAAAGHAEQGLGMLMGGAPGAFRTGGRASQELVRYMEDLKRAARAKACRFMGINAEAEGETGKGIAYLRAARQELGFSPQAAGSADDGGDGSRAGGAFSRFKRDFQEKREDRKIEKGGEWGSDAGRLEEARICDGLSKKWEKMNSTVNVQAVPPTGPLLASLPSGRDYHTPQTYQPMRVDEATLARMRAPPDPAASASRADSDDDSDNDAGAFASSGPPGAFPGAAPGDTASQYY